MPELATSVIILAGGDSRRFGTTKALVDWHGKRLVDHVADRIAPMGDTTIVVTNPLPEEPAWPGDKVVYDDRSKPAGPLRGIVRGLLECTADWAWMVACDTPLVSAELLLALRREAEPGDVAVTPTWEGRCQPLVACWEKAAGPALAELLASGEHSPGAALDRLGCRVFPDKRCREIDPEGRSFFNVNRPEDLAELDRLVADNK
jgi:molybdopterin-guanine dinucleotide biosynthesis protein A